MHFIHIMFLLASRFFFTHSSIFFSRVQMHACIDLVGWLLPAPKSVHPVKFSFINVQLVHQKYIIITTTILSPLSVTAWAVVRRRMMIIVLVYCIFKILFLLLLLMIIIIMVASMLKKSDWWWYMLHIIFQMARFFEIVNGAGSFRKRLCNAQV